MRNVNADLGNPNISEKTHINDPKHHNTYGTTAGTRLGMGEDSKYFVNAPGRHQRVDFE
jgi:hypothetical protein